MTTPREYLAAMREARRKGLAIDARAARVIERALLDWADELERIVRRIPAGQSFTARRSAQLIREAARDLERAIARATLEAIELKVERVLEVWQDASLRVAESRDVPDAMMGALARPEITSAAAFVSTAATRQWRSLIADRTGKAAADVSRIVSSAIVRGVHPEQLARSLRPYVLGRDRTPDAIREETAPRPGRHADAYTVDHNAKRIAFTETHVARREAEVAHFQRDPLITYGRWTLSPNRGTQRLPCVCDALAGLNWYGLGVALYSLDAVPLGTHPWCRCELIPVLGAATKGVPSLVLNPWSVPLPRQGEMTAAAETRIRATLSRVLVVPQRARRMA